MKSFSLKNTVSVLGLAVAVLIGVSNASAQSRGRISHQQNQVIKQQQKIDKQNLKLEQERIRLERQRLQSRNGNRFRVNRGGQWYNVDNRQADLLKQAINQGYRQGFSAGRTDRNSRRRMSWTNSNVYQSGTYGYQSYVNRSLYQHYFQQGFQRGYQDGFSSRNQFGTGNGGSILGNILQGILGLQTY
jgi:flagellar biosynthesis/type III secretory pathway protein FliH